MATDKDLHKAFSDELEVWAPVHAWRALGQLKAQQAIEPLIGLFDELIDDDWIDDELPTVFALIGPAALPFLANYLSDQTNGKSPLILAASCISEIGLKNKVAREKSIAILTKQLAAFDVNDSELN